MSTINLTQTSLYCHFNEIIKGPRTSFQSPAPTQKHDKHKYNFLYVPMSMMMSHILISVNFTKKSNKNQDISKRKHYFFFKEKNSLTAHQ